MNGKSLHRTYCAANGTREEVCLSGDNFNAYVLLLAMGRLLLYGILKLEFAGTSPDWY